MLIWISKIPKIPMGNPKIPILLHNGHTNSSSWSKKTKLELFGLFEIYCITLQQRSESVFLHLVLVVHIANNQNQYINNTLSCLLTPNL